MKSVFCSLLIVVLLIGASASFNIQPAKGEGTIYIRADGSIDPPTAPIVTADNVTYVFTANISDSIAVERGNIVVDGSGYTVQGTGSGTGIYVSGRSNVTITNTNVKNYNLGINLIGSSLNTFLVNNITNNDYAIYLVDSSNDNIMLENNITNNFHGIYVHYSSFNAISRNNITNNSYAIYLSSSSDNTISGNNIANNYDGINLYGSSSNIISENDIAANSNYGISLDGGSSSNSVYGNNITNNGNCGIRFYSPLQSSTTGNNTIWGNNITNNHDGAVLYDSDNNTVSGNNITANSVHGIYLGGSSYGIDSSFNAISGNNITDNSNGIYLDVRSANTTISGNNVANNYDGVVISSSSDNTISGNSITANNYLGIYLDSSSSNTLSENNITNTEYGIQLLDSPSNKVFHNNFKNNAFQALAFNSPLSAWDDGYPSGGNHWSDYVGADIKSGPNQDQLGSDGIGDTSYIFDYGRDRYPLMNPWTGPVHDVAVTDIVLSKTVVGYGYRLNITVTAVNQGDYTETFNITAYANATIIGSENITLTAANFTTITLAWNTTGFSKGNYTISAYASPVPNETDTADNTLFGYWVFVAMPGDVNADGIVDIFDCVIVALAFGSTHSDPIPPWNPNADINSDGTVDIFDIVVVALHFGETS